MAWRAGSNTGLDDRGRACDVPLLQRRTLSALFIGKTPREGGEAVRSEMMVAQTAAVFAVVIGAVAGLFVWRAVLALTPIAVGAGAARLLEFLFMGVCAAALWRLTLVWLRPARAGVLQRAYVRDGCCGGCAYALADLEPEDDGCVVCPECGAAWKQA